MSNYNNASTSPQLLTSQSSIYEALFVASNGCQPFALGEGTTAFGIEKIREVTLQNLYQINKQKAIELFKKSTLKATVQAIHQFLQWQFVYKPDMYEQYLPSPSCAWEQRYQGIECKTNAIIASSILCHLGIKHAFRRVRNAAYMSETFSHIYIIVPHNNSYLVLDGTNPLNIEPPTLETQDLYMDPILPYYGMNGPGTTTVVSTRTTATTTEQQQVFNTNFKVFCEMLATFGVSATTITRMRALVTVIRSKGKEVPFNMNENAITINSQVFDISKRRPRTANPKYILRATRNSEGGESQSVDMSQLVNEVSSSGWYDNTLGAVFGNNFMISCWGSANNPEKSKQQSEIDYQYALEILKPGITPESLTAFSLYMNAYIWTRDRGRHNGELNSCTRKGNEAAFEFFDKIYKETITKVKNELAKQGIGLVGTLVKRTNFYMKTPSEYLGDGYHVNDFTSFQYTFTNNPNTSTTTANNATTANLNTNQAAANTGGQNSDQPDKEEKKSGIGGLAKIAIPVAAYFLFR